MQRGHGHVDVAQRHLSCAIHVRIRPEAPPCLVCKEPWPGVTGDVSLAATAQQVGLSIQNQHEPDMLNGMPPPPQRFLVLCCAQYGISCNWRKVEILPIHCEPHIPKPDGPPIRIRESMVYLEGLLHASGTATAELNRRLGLEPADFHALCRVWKHAVLDTTTKVQTFSCYGRTCTATSELCQIILCFVNNDSCNFWGVLRNSVFRDGSFQLTMTTTHLGHRSVQTCLRCSGVDRKLE